MKIVKFYKGDLVRVTEIHWSRWGSSELIAIVEDVELENDTFTLFYRPWYNWIKYIYKIIKIWQK